MNQYPKMLYKAGGPYEIHGGNFDYIIVDDEASKDLAISEGWCLTTPEALEAAVVQKRLDLEPMVVEPVKQPDPKPPKTTPDKTWGKS